VSDLDQAVATVVECCMRVRAGETVLLAAAGVLIAPCPPSMDA